MNKENKEKSFLSQLRDLEVGESIQMPISRRSYVSVAVSRFSVEWDKGFSTRSDRELKTVTVTRTA